MTELRNEYFSRLSQHMKLESELVKLMQKRHEVNTLCLPVLLVRSSLYTVAPKQQVFYLLMNLVLKMILSLETRSLEV